MFYTVVHDKLLETSLQELRQTSTNYEATCKLTVELTTYWNDRAMEGQYELGGRILWPWRGAEARAVALFGVKADRTTLPKVFQITAEQLLFNDKPRINLRCLLICE